MFLPVFPHSAIRNSMLHKPQGQWKKEALLLAGLLERIAPRIGARVLVEPEWRFVGQITFRTGRRSYFRYNTLDLNPIGASDIARDKDWSNFFMKTMGYPVVPGTKAFYERGWRGRSAGPGGISMGLTATRGD